MSFLNKDIRKILEKQKEEREYIIKHSLHNVNSFQNNDSIIIEMIGKIIGIVIGTFIGWYIVIKVLNFFF